MNIGKVLPAEITTEVQKAYLDYAMSVIVARALPDVRDGLKPVHRRILFAMHQMGLVPGSGYTKSAKVVGETMGKYHPHGDAPIYEALVRLAQDFSMRYPVVDGQGNFGSVDGDPPAAMRYCVTGDTLVITKRGLQPIERVSTNNSENIKNAVLSFNRVINKTSKWFDSGKHPTIKITTRQGFNLQGTYNHPVLVWTQDKDTRKPKYQWKLLGEITLGDIVVIDRTQSLLWPQKEVYLKIYIPRDLPYRVKKRVIPKTLNKHLAFILGSLISEGSVGQKKIEFCNTDSHWIEKFESCWKRVFPDSKLHKFYKKPSSWGKKPYFRLETHNIYTIDFLKNIGLEPVRAAKKTIPALILQSSKNIVKSFLQAYFEGDGSISSAPKMVELSAISVSTRLISELQVLLLRFGIVGTKRYDRYRNTHKLYLRGLRNYKLFAHEIGFLSSKKKGKLQKILNTLYKDQSILDSIPYLREYVLANADYTAPWEKRQFLEKHNFDRSSNLIKNNELVTSLVSPTVRPEVQQLLRQIMTCNYAYDEIVSIEDRGIQKVYSLKVESKCHSFVANGFINHNTEVRLAKISEALLADIEKDTVRFDDNFDATIKEPGFLPAVLPNLLLMGAEGIAVGMATKIPPHNLTEVAEAISATIKKGQTKKTNGEVFFIKKIDLAVSEGKQTGNIEVTAPEVGFDSEITTDELLHSIKGPDFPTGGAIYDGKSLAEIYGSGRGKIIVRGIAKIEEAERGKTRILITELPYQVNKAQLVAHIAALARDKKIQGISDLRDESDKRGMTVVVELKKDARPKAVLNNLYKHTALQTSFPANFVALVDDVPHTLTLKQILVEYVRHRQKVVTRRSIFELTEAKRRAHILEGLKIALDHLDEVIQTIRRSRDSDTAKDNLMKKFGFTDVQATAILDMQLRRLSALEREKIEEEYKKVGEQIDYLTDLLTHPEKILGVIGKELSEVKAKYGDERRTRIYQQALGEISEQDLVAKEETIVTITHTGYIKRVRRDTYRAQRRGGKGVVGMTTKEEDSIAHITSCSTHDQLLFFTDQGRVFGIRAWELTETARQSKGQAIVNLINIDQGEQIQAVLAVEQQEGERFLFMATRGGTVKKTKLSDFKNLRASGLIALKLDKGDQLVWVRPTSGEDNILLATKKGKAIRFPEKDVRPMGRTAHGVKGITLGSEDQVIGMEVVPSRIQKPKDNRRKFFNDILAAMENGLGKRTPVGEFPLQKRGGMGVKIANINDKTGDVVSALMVTQDAEQIIITSKSGQVIKLPLKNIPQLGRATQGVILMRFAKHEKKDSVAAVAILEKEEVSPEENVTDNVH